MSTSTRVLVVDDEVAIVESAGDYLRTRGFDVATARELEEAEALVVVDTYDVVVTDVRLTARGREEGLDLTSFVNGRSPRTGIIVVTAYPSEEVQRIARENGACLVLQKPVSLPLIEQNIRAIASSCTVRGTGTSLCDPLRRVCGEYEHTADVARLGVLLSEVAANRTGDENEASIAAALRILETIELSANESLSEMLGFCLTGSRAIASMIEATEGQEEARRVAVMVQRRVESLKAVRKSA